MKGKTHNMCGECEHIDLDDDCNLTCTVKKKEVRREDDASDCEDYRLSSELIREGAVCQVCEYFMMDDYCSYKKLYILDVNWEVCEGFEPCEEYVKGQIGW